MAHSLQLKSNELLDAFLNSFLVGVRQRKDLKFCIDVKTINHKKLNHFKISFNWAFVFLMDIFSNDDVIQQNRDKSVQMVKKNQNVFSCTPLTADEPKVPSFFF